MDPLTALSVASSVIQFVDFGSKLITNVYHIYTSANGVLAENLDLEATTYDLSQLMIRLSPSQHEKFTCNTKEQQDLEDLVLACAALASQLLKALQKLKVDKDTKDRKWMGFRQALRAVWSKKDLDEMAERLAGLKNQLEFHTIVSLRASTDLYAIQQDERFDRLDSSSREFIKTLAENNRKFSTDLKTQTMTISSLHQKAETNIKNHIDRSEAHILEAMRSTEIPSRDHPPSNTPVVESIEADKVYRENSILQSLGFPSLYSRYENVAEAHAKTFNWIFDNSNHNETPWSSFTEWWQGNERIYWISGKVGSGKSTLIKYICEDTRTQQLLAGWNETQGPVLMAAFFFWLSGTTDQSSQLGLLRSLLHDILSQRRDLIPVLFPDQWAAADPKLENYRSQTRSWTIQYAKEALKRLFKMESLGKVALFIDGLDEYSGDHEEMTTLFQNIESPNIKICVSSRPYVIFEDAFGSGPKLRLQDLTYNDVKIYVDDKLAEDKRMKALCLLEPIEAPKLVHGIVKQADGVFLWVILVIRSLLTGLRNKDQISHLQKRLRLIPSEITALYRHMLTQIDPLYLGEGSRLFQLKFAAEYTEKNLWSPSDGHSEALSTLGMFFAKQDPASFDINAPIQRLNKIEVQMKTKEIDYRLKTCCAGLLEVGKAVTGDALYNMDSVVLEAELGNRRVEYLHRSTKDFLDLPDVRKFLLNKTKRTGFDPNMALLRSTISLLKAYQPSPPLGMTIDRSSKNDQYCVVGLALTLARQVEIETGNPATELLDEFDRTALRIWPSDCHYSTGILCDYFRYTLYPTVEGISCFKHDFLAMAIVCRLPLYIESKLRENPSIISEKGGVPYIGYALTSTSYGKSNMDRRIVEILTDYGSNPNESFNESTPWKRALYSVISHHFGKFRVALDSDECLDWIKVFKLLLKNGADIHVQTRKSRKRGPERVFSVTDVINTCFGDRFPTETAQLLALVEKRGNNSSSLNAKQPAVVQHSKGNVPSSPRHLSVISRSKVWLERRLYKRSRN